MSRGLHARLTRAALLALLVGAAACKRSQPEVPASPPAPTAEQREPLKAEAPSPAAAVNTGTAPSTPPPAPADASASQDAGTAPADTVAADWTAATVDVKRPELKRPVQLQAVRAARNEGFDRVVFEYAGDTLPGYHVEYVDRPVRDCGSGDEVPLSGQGWLSIRMQPARGHTEAGEATVKERVLKTALPVVLEMKRTCDFEGEVTWVLGNQSPKRFRVLELKGPARLVVDVQH